MSEPYMTLRKGRVVNTFSWADGERLSWECWIPEEGPISHSGMVLSAAYAIVVIRRLLSEGFALQEGRMTDTPKSLGRVAYEATDAAPDWDDIGPHNQATWQAAAEAVAAEVTSQAAINEQMFYSPMSPIRDEERAVIEAAKAWLESFDSVEGNGFDDDNLLAAAVEALQEVE